MPGPNDHLKLSNQGLALIADFEGFVDHLYEDQAGHTTIGYGHLVHRGGITEADRRGQFGRGITRQQGLALLRDDADSAAGAVRQAARVALRQNQFDALVSFTFNLGGGALRGSTLLRKLNAGDFAGAADEFKKWNKADGKVSQGLVRRRKAEADLFRGGGAGPAPGPAPRPEPVYAPMRYVKADVPQGHPEHGKVYVVTAQGRTWVKRGFAHMDWLAARGIGPSRDADGDFPIVVWPLENLLTFPLVVDRS